MSENWIRKTMVLVVMGLFIGAGVVPSITGNEKNISNNKKTESYENLIFEFSFDEPQIERVRVLGETYDRINIKDLPTIGETGEPILPIKPVYVLLPQGEKFNSIEIEYGEKISLGEGFNVELGREPVPISEKPNYNPSMPDLYKNSPDVFNESYPIDEVTFDTSKPFPVENCSMVGTYQCRGYDILIFNLNPVHYTEITGELSYFSLFKVTIKTDEKQEVNDLYRALERDKERVKQMVENPEYIATYSEIPCNRGRLSSIVDPSDSYDYVIITTQKLANSHGKYTFQNLIDLKQRKGLNATIVTIEDITNESAYWNTTKYLFNDTQSQIRNFIRDAYLNWEAEYVLLGGDSDVGNEVLPARMLWVASGQGDKTTMPSDLYYACLDGNYNSNENNLWGEPTDGVNGSDVDLMAEVYVGRAPVDSSEEVSNFVLKTLMYEYTYDKYLEKVLMVGEQLSSSTWGGNYKDEIINGSSANGYITVGIPIDIYNITTLYERDWPGNDWHQSELIGFINNGTHIVNHMGHANANTVIKLSESDVDSLTNDNYCFVYSQGCYAGAFDEDDCIAEHFTTANHCAFAVIMNARYGWYRGYSTDGPSQYYDREFFDAIFNESLTELGKANQDSKQDNLWRINDACMRWCFYEITLFGDPELSLKEPITPAHDVAVSSLDVALYVIPNETFQVKATIINYGNHNESNILVNFTVNGIVGDNETISILGSGDETILSFNCSLSAGIHKVGVDIQSIPNENITFNNFLDRTVISGPDIAVTNVVIPSPPLYISTTVEIAVTVKNLGKIDVNNVNLSLLIDGVIVDNTTISISSGESVIRSLTWVPNCSKWHNVSCYAEVVANENYTIIENNYFNTTAYPVNINDILYVDSKGSMDFKKIKDAFYWIGDGGTIFVYNGTYYEYLVLDKTINLIGEDRNTTVIDGYKSGGVIHVSADWVNISNFTIKNSGSYNPRWYPHGILLNYSSNTQIINCTVYNNYRGIFMYYSSNTQIINCTVYNSSTFGIIFINSLNNQLTNCTIYSNYYGIRLYYSSNNTLKGVVLQNNTYNFGVFGPVKTYYHDIDTSNTINGKPMYYIIEQSNLTFDNNMSIGYLGLISCTNITIRNITSINNGQGILLANTSYSTIKNCIVYNCYSGLSTPYSSDNTITNCNTHRNHGIGIILSYSSDNTITNCNSYNNTEGYHIECSSNNNQLINCNVYNNNYGADHIGSNNNQITNCTFYNNSFTIINSCSNNRITKCTIHNNGYGIMFVASNNQVKNCTVYNNGRGIAVQQGSCNTAIKNCTFHNNQYGVYLCNSANNNSITDCTAYNNTYGVYLCNSANNNSITDCTAYNNTYGVYLCNSANNNIISKNTLIDNNYGIFLEDSSNNNITDCTAYNNTYGVYLYYSSHNIVSDNSFSNDGLYVWNSYQNSVSNNTVNSKFLVYLEEESDTVIDYGGQIILVNCDNITIQNQELSNTIVGIELWDTDNSRISGNNISNNNYGIGLYYSSNNNVSDNNVMNNHLGIYLCYSSNNNVFGNNISSNNNLGIYLYYSSNYNNVSDNNVSNNCYGIGLYYSSNYNNVFGNNISSNSCDGIALDFSSNNNISCNNISNSLIGIALYFSSNNNLFYHNNFINNTYHNMQAYDECNNNWDNGYPSGGNYWSDFDEPSEGAYDNDSDGIVDSPYNISGGSNQDRYPLIYLWGKNSPIANFTYLVDNRTVTFNASSSYDRDGTIVSYEWDFGDGENDTGMIVDHTYATNGTYQVNLTVTDDDGASDTKSKNISVGNIPPVANFSYSPLYPTTNDIIQFTDTSNDSGKGLVNWTWNFDDGNTSTEQNPSHQYSDDEDYNVCLTVEDDDGATDTVCKTVTVDNVGPVANFSYLPLNPTTLDVIQFTDLSTDPGKGLVNWTWNFDDGNTSYLQNPIHNYGDDGNYNVTLTVRDDGGASDSTTKQVNVSNVDPVADFSYTPPSPTTADTIVFSDNSSDVDGIIVNWTWNFDDGNISHLQNPTHNYSDNRDYNVYLTVEDDDGAIDTCCKTVTVLNIGPTADFTWTPPNPTTEDVIQFLDNSSDRGVVNWTWNFDDGNISYEQNPIHQYSNPSMYTVCLTVKDDDNATDTTCKIINVTSAVEIIDVNQSIFNRGFPIRHAIDGDWAGAQSFTPTLDTLTRVDIYLRKFGAPEFNLTVELREDGPEGTLLDTVVFTPSEVASSWTWVTIDIDDVNVGVGSDIFIVLPPAPSGVTTSFGYEWGYAFGNQYDGGSFWFTRDGGGLWRDLPTMYEFVFRTYGYS